MKVFLDDERNTPDGWVRVYWPDEAVKLLSTGEVVELSLDHDLGDDERGTGYDVVLGIEEAVALRGFDPPLISVHSANSSARQKMEAGIAAITRIQAATSLPINISCRDTLPRIAEQDRLEVWYDGSAICLIAVGAHGDPLDLSDQEIED